MSHSGITKEKRIISGIIAIMMFAVIMISSLFIAIEADHDCCGEDCPICSFVTVCENTLRHVTEGIAAVALVVFSYVVLILLENPVVLFITQETPVSAKVRLNN